MHEREPHRASPGGNSALRSTIASRAAKSRSKAAKNSAAPILICALGSTTTTCRASTARSRCTRASSRRAYSGPTIRSPNVSSPHAPSSACRARYAIARHSQATASSVLFKLRDDEAARLDDEYSTFKPRSFAIDDTRRGVIVNYCAAGEERIRARTRSPRSSLGASCGTTTRPTMICSSGATKAARGPLQGWQTGPAPIEFFSIVRAAAYAAILNLIPGKAWEEYSVRRSCRSGWRAWSETARRSTPMWRSRRPRAPSSRSQARRSSSWR